MQARRPRAGAALPFLVLLGALVAGLTPGLARAATNSWVVTSAADTGGTCAPFSCTLRAAISAANASTGGDVITFAIQPAGSYTISVGAGAANGLPDVTGDDVTIDATTQPGGSAHPIRLDDPDVGGGESGLVLSGNRAVVRGFSITRFDGYGILIRPSTGDTIAGNWIGTSDGAASQGNGNDGIHVTGGGGHTIGGTTAADRNVLSAAGGGQEGLELESSSDNVVVGNYVGMTADGLGRLPNTDTGIEVNGISLRNRIGGTSAGERNVVSGNTGIGIQLLGIANLDGTCNAPRDNVVLGNYAGVGATGARPAPYGNGGAGIELGACAQSNTIGGAVAGAANVASGNHDDGIQLDGNTGPGGSAGVCGNTVLGNLVGLDPTGTVNRPNTDDGIDLDRGACNNVVGGLTAAEANVVAGNQGDGIDLHERNSAGTATNGNTIQGNVIGLALNGSTGISNLQSGIHLRFTSKDNIVDGNVIATSGAYGIHVESATTTGNVIRNNSIGTTRAGTGIRGNTLDGIRLTGGASQNRIEMNTITGSGAAGVVVEVPTGSPDQTSRNRITRNRLSANAGLGIDLLPVAGRNANDGTTSTTVGNLGLDTPTIVQATSASAKGTAPAGSTVELFTAAPGTGETAGEGASFLGSAIAGTDGSWCIGALALAGSATATATDAAGNTSEFSPNVVAAGSTDLCAAGQPQAPTVVTDPAVSGTPSVGNILTASTGTWNGTQPITYAYEWRRCDDAGAACTPIPGASASQYTLVAADQGSTIRVAVTASNSVGSGTASSAPTAVVQAAGGGGTILTDTFTRTVSNGWGSVGSLSWSVSGTASEYSVDGATGRIRAAGATGARLALLPIAQRDITQTLRFRLPTLPTSGWEGAYLLARTSGSNTWYGLRVRSVAVGGDDLELNVSKGAVSKIGSTAPIPKLQAGAWYRLRLETVGDGTSTTVRGRVWADAATEPQTWQVSATDTTAALQVAGGTGVRLATGSGTAPNPALDVDDLTVSAAGTAPPPQAPTSVSAPTVSGSAVVGSVLTADPGSWNGTQPIGYAYEWRRCDTAGNGCTAIPGAATSQYTLAAADQGATIRVAVTASNTAGASTAVSASTGVVQSATQPPTSVTKPTVSGSAVVESVLTADPGSWNGTQPIGYAYEWRRCDTAGNGCTAIPGATTSQYTLAAADQGATIRVAVTASNTAGASTAVSDQTSVVAAAPGGGAALLTDTFSRTVSNGWGTVGAFAWSVSGTASEYSVDGAAGRIRATTATGTRVALLPIGQRDITQTIRFRIPTLPATGWQGVYLLARAGGTTSWYGLRARSVASGGDDLELNLSTPTGGIVKLGSTAGIGELQAGGWYVLRLETSGDGTSTTVRGRLWADGATEPTAWQVSATDTTAPLQAAAGTGVRLSTGSGTTPNPSVDVDDLTVTGINSAPAPVTLPTLIGLAESGQRLRAQPGTWDGVAPTYAYAWERCNTSGGACTPIAGASGSTYVVATADVGARIRTSVTATNASGSATATSQPTGVTGASPVIAAAGDIACEQGDSRYNGGAGTAEACRQLAVSDLLVGGGFSAVLALGDTQYDCASLGALQSVFNASWGRVKSLIRPAVGNHEYNGTSAYGDTGCTGDAAGYFDYFGSSAGPRGLGYYSFDIGSWHVISLSSECYAIAGCGAGSREEQWLRSDLAAHPALCTLAFWHKPRWSSGKSGSTVELDTLWRDLADGGVDVLLSGHDHHYERFAPLAADGTSTPNGLRQFVVGSGGKEHYDIAAPIGNSQVNNVDTFGVLALALDDGSYDWSFLPEAGKSFTDSGTTACH
jgi:CSLREA domain-containing protein